MNEGLPSVSVVVPTYGRADHLEQILLALLQDEHAREVIVVDDGSPDDTPAVLRRLSQAHPALRVIRQANAGQGRARRTGVEAATGDVVLLLDDDVEPAPGLVRGHARAHRDRRDAVVLGYMPVGERPGPSPDAFTSMLYAEAYEGRCAAWEADPGQILRSLWAGNVSLRRETALRVGLTSDAFHERYHEDQELGLRLLAAGAVGIFDRSLRATHHYERSVDAFLRDARRQGSGSAQIRALHGALAGPLPRDRFERGAPPAVATLIRACRRPGAQAVVAAALRGLLVLTAKRRMAGVQLRAARVLRRIEQQRGAIERHRRAIERGRRGATTP